MCYLVAGADVLSALQELQHLVDVPGPCRSQEAGVAVRLQGEQSVKTVSAEHTERSRNGPEHGTMGLKAPSVSLLFQ